jgi:hypothetical protein
MLIIVSSSIAAGSQSIMGKFEKDKMIITLGTNPMQWNNHDQSINILLIF